MRSTRLLVLALALVAPTFAAPVVQLAAATVTPVQAASASATARATAPDYRETRTLTRSHLGADGQEQVVAQNTVTVVAEETDELRGRERVRIRWSGARPSGGRSSDPFGEHGLTQEYPVVILQCRGVDDPAAPVAQQLRPETCFTSTSLQRSSVVPQRLAVWRHDRYEDEAGRAERSGRDPFPAEQCRTPSAALFAARVTPFVSADGTEHLGCDASTMPPEAAIGSSFPPAELMAFTNDAGEGAVDFEVRSDVENGSLGCNDKTECAVVVIPIMGISCLDADTECRRNGSFIPGSSNFEGAEPQPAVSGRYWWSESNWRHRFTIPLDFGLPPDTCEVLDPRPPVGFYGSELLSQAALQWSPAYCLDEDRFKFQHNRMPDDAGFTLMSSGGAVAALVSGPQEQRGEDPIGFAPTAVTGFGIGFVVDRPDNAGQLDRLRLNPRLLAKLLTQSYPASVLGRGHPGMEQNPLTINQDPEFIELNPGLDTRDREAAATLLSLSNSSDVVEALTSYIDQDADARAFIDGEPDEWGMRVNPSYESLDLPVREWPLLDDYRPPAQPGTCREANNSVPYLTQVAAPVTALRSIADALIDSWPNVQTTCEGPLAGGLYKTGRVARQSFGQRFMLGVVSLPDAARYGLRTAALATSGGRFVEPSEESLSRAIALATRSEGLGPFVLDQADVRRDGRAYPGTMTVFTAARLSGMAPADARLVASFIRISTSEGQQLGRGNGQLPAGYLPIRSAGPTADLRAAALEVADAIQAQRGLDEEPVQPGDGDGGPTAPPGGGGVVTGGPGGVPVVDVPVEETAPAAETPERVPTVSSAPVVMPDTLPVSSRVAGGFLPSLLLLVVASALLAGVLQVRRRLGGGA